VPTTYQKSRPVGVNPEREILICDAARDVGFSNPSEVPVSDLFPEVRNHIVDRFLDFDLENCQFRFHVAEQFKSPSKLMPDWKPS